MVLPQFSKTRLAPTPSGHLHLGNVFSFVLTLALARQADAGLLLRIDDMDRERAAPQFLQDIFDTLQFLQMPWSIGPKTVQEFEASWSQTVRLPLYYQALEKLMESGHVFACTCSRTEILKQSVDGSYPGTCRNKGLPLDLPGAALRIKTPDTVDLSLQTMGGLQTVKTLPAAVRDFVVQKKDGKPAYQLCSVVDDLYFGIDFVVRGADLWPSTVAQCWLSSLLPSNAFSQIVFVHHSLLQDKSGSKLSKSAGHTSVYGLRKEGFTAQQVFEELSRMINLHPPVLDWQALSAVLLQHSEWWTKMISS